MNLSAAASLPLKAETRVWHRAVETQFLPSALQSRHTPGVFSRYSPGPLGQPPFEIIYLAENQLVAMLEVGALFGNPLAPGTLVANPSQSWATVNVKVQLQAIADVTQALPQQALRTTAQELTGDWRGYRSRSIATSVSQPVGIAPTQQLGEALKQDSRQVEGFISLSAKPPYHQSLVVFPANLRPGSSLTFNFVDANGQQQSMIVAP